MAVIDALEGAIVPHLATGQTVVLDLTEVTFADSSLLKVLQEARGKASEGGGALFVRNPSEGVRKLLSLGELDDLVQAEALRQNEANEAPHP